MSTAKKPSSILDPFVMTLVAVVVIASIFPCYGRGAALFDLLASVAIVLLFFLHGAKLSRSAIVDGMLNWRLHIATLMVTFMVFPLLGLLIVRMPWLDPSLLAGMLYLTLLPSTVQSSIAFTSMAKGNVPAAVCAATLSNLLGMFITPFLVAMLIQIPNVQSQVSMGSVQKIAMQLLLPFIVGHLMRPWIGSWVEQHKKTGREGRSWLDFVGRVYGIQRGGDRWVVEPSFGGQFDRVDRNLFGVAGSGFFSRVGCWGVGCDWKEEMRLCSFFVGRRKVWRREYRWQERSFQRAKWASSSCQS